MKKLNFLYTPILAACALLVFQSCEEEEAVAVTFDRTITVSHEEANETILIPIRGTGGFNASDLEFSFGGTATLDEDFAFKGFSIEEGVSIEILDDDVYEKIETINILMTSKSGLTVSNANHKITITNDCDWLAADGASEFDSLLWTGSYSALEDYGGGDTYGPYHVEFEVYEDDPTELVFHNFWDSGIEAVVKMNPNTGTVVFPDFETPYGIISGEGTFNQCDKSFTIETHFTYDGGQYWVYTFTAD